MPGLKTRHVLASGSNTLACTAGHKRSHTDALWPIQDKEESRNSYLLQPLRAEHTFGGRGKPHTMRHSSYLACSLLHAAAARAPKFEPYANNHGSAAAAAEPWLLA